MPMNTILANSNKSTARPSLLSVPIQEKTALYEAYMPFLTHGGLFVATTKPYKIGDEIYLILSLMDDPTKYPVSGKVAWLTPAEAHNNKPQGIGIHFSDDESGQRVKRRIEELLGSALGSSRTTHTL